VTLEVLHVHAGNLYGGVETILTTLARNSGASQDTCHRYALCFEGRLSEELRAEGATVDPLGVTRVRRPWTVLHARRRLSELLASTHVDVAVSHSAWSQAIFGPVIQMAGVRSTFWLHGARGPRWLELWARRTPVDLVLCNSRYTAAAPHGFAGARSEVCYYPVAPGQQVEPEDRLALRRSGSIPEDTCVILQASRMESGKGHAVLLDALAAIRGRTDWECWIAGGAQRRSEVAYEDSLRRRSSALGFDSRVHFLGQRDDVPQLMGAADLFCHPHTAPEAFGIVFVEAMYRGLPVVGSASGGPTEIVNPDCGLLVEPGNPRALATALTALLDDPARRTEMGAHGPARARELCDPETQTRRLAAILRRLSRPAADAA
jgi:glycosyltransferase involved in cell wall biosynthesis